MDICFGFMYVYINEHMFRFKHRLCFKTASGFVKVNSIQLKLNILILIQSCLNKHTLFSMFLKWVFLNKKTL